MTGEMLKSKAVEITMVLDGKEFKLTAVIPEGTAQSQWTRCQRVGDTVAKSILYYSDIKAGIYQ